MVAKLLRRLVVLSSTAVFLAVSAAHAIAQVPAAHTIVFMSDFGVIDDSVALCKGVMHGINPSAPIFDITHQVTPFDIGQAARFLAGTAPYYPDDAIFVVVVDPGVGSQRKAIIAKSRRGQFFVLPDNGLLTLIADRDEIAAVREISNPGWMIGARLSSTFHGRDIFSPAAAHLSRGDDWATAGPSIDPHSLVRLEIHTAAIEAGQLKGQVIGLDGPYGNLVTNVPSDLFARLGYKLGDAVPVTIGSRQEVIPFYKTFSDVPVGKPLFYIDSRGRLSLAVNQGNFATVYKVDVPSSLLIRQK